MTHTVEPTGVEHGSTYRLDARYRATQGRVLLTGVQALARLPLDQLRIDAAAGLNTAAFASGYPGSPLGGLDTEMARAQRLVPDLPFVHQPAVNEELGATSVMGSPARRHPARCPLRRGGRLLVRQGPRTRPGRRRPPPRRAFAGASARRVGRSCPGRRRSGLQVVDDAVVIGRHPGRPPHAHPLPGHDRRVPRARPPRRGHLPGHGTLVVDEDRHPHRRRLRHGASSRP